MNSWGITEPESGELVSPKCLDMVLVPLLVFDKQGKRVGYGKGFYDRFLSQCRSNVLKVGLSYFKPIEKIGDADTYDIPLDICVTPDEIWYF
jgi:5-formyltetrahydrofolate cyclo-ligase